jgi:hypothetical protein
MGSMDVTCFSQPENDTLLKTTQNAQTDIKWLSAHPTVLARIQR